MNFLRDRLSKLIALFLLVVLTELPVLVNHFYRSMIDPDIWWHLRVGDWILHFREVPKVGIFSKYAEGHAWVAYSWGFEVIMASLFRLWGLAAIPMTLSVFRAIIVFTLLLVMLRLTNRFWISWLITAAAIIPITSVLVIRPVLFTVLFFTIGIGLVFEARRTGSIRPLYWFPALMLVWSNVHIQFVYGLGLLGLFVICELLRSFIKSDKATWMSSRPLNAPAIRLLGVLLLSILATLIGPNWGNAYLVIFRYAQNTSQYNQISELVALTFRQASDYYVIFLLMGACFALGKKRIDLFTASLLLVSAIASFRANRDAWFVCLVACGIIAESLERKDEDRAPATTSLRLQYAGAFLVAILAAFGYASRVGLTPANLIEPIDNMYPVRATEYIRSHHLEGPMYNSFNWGGFLIFNLREYPVSIDGRNDFYGTVLFDRMQNTVAGVNWRTDPDLEASRFVILEKTQPLATLLSVEPGYTLAYSDHVAAVFVKTSAQREPMAGSFPSPTIKPLH